MGRVPLAVMNHQVITSLAQNNRPVIKMMIGVSIIITFWLFARLYNQALNLHLGEILKGIGGKLGSFTKHLFSQEKYARFILDF